jgi:hypothetical protein
MSGDLQRASDAERERVVLELRDDLVAGRLTLDEFSERVGAAYGATFTTELVRLRDDLPEPVLEPSRRHVRLSVAVFGHLVRRGRLRLRRRTTAVSAFGDLDLDLRDALLESETVALHLYVLAGNADVYVPEGVDVEVGGTIVLGRRRDWGRDAPLQRTPRVRVHAHGLLGTVDVWRVPSGVHGTYGEVIAQVEARQRGLPAGAAE